MDELAPIGGGATSGTAYDAVWGRAFATLYDAAFVLAERRGFRDVRRNLVGRAKDQVVELGAGTGLNLEHYASEVSALLLTEPDPHIVARLRKRIAADEKDITVAQTSADAIPMNDASVDALVSTFVLCTVPDPRRVLREAARVLRPGGVFLFAEHVRSENSRVAKWQDRLNRPWSWYACQCNRDTISYIRESPLHLVDVTMDRLRWISPLVRPLAIGVAVKEAVP